MVIFQLSSLSNVDDHETHTKRVAAMIEQLPQRRAHAGPSGLFTVYGVESRIGPKGNGGVEEAPGRDIFAESEIVEENDDS